VGIKISLLNDKNQPKSLMPTSFELLLYNDEPMKKIISPVPSCLYIDNLCPSLIGGNLPANAVGLHKIFTEGPNKVPFYKFFSMFSQSIGET
jgi:hypothetical protein